MFPIGDDNSDRRTRPYVNYVFIFINLVVFVLLQGIGGNDAFTYAFSLVPKEITTGIDLYGAQIVRDSLGNVGELRLEPTPGSVYLTFLSSMFMHGSIMHIFGNMLFLWVFGDNIENRLGHIRYVLFYVVCGFAAAAGADFDGYRFDNSDARRVGRDFRRSRRLSAALSETPRPRDRL